MLDFANRKDMGHSCTSARERKLSRIADRIDQVLLDGLAESVDPSVTLVQYLMKTYKNVVLDSLDFADIRQWLILNPNHFDQLNREMMEVESSIKWGQLQLSTDCYIPEILLNLPDRQVETTTSAPAYQQERQQRHIHTLDINGNRRNRYV